MESETESTASFDAAAVVFVVLWPNLYIAVFSVVFFFNSSNNLVKARIPVMMALNVVITAVISNLSLLSFPYFRHTLHSNPPCFIQLFFMHLLFPLFMLTYLLRALHLIMSSRAGNLYMAKYLLKATHKKTEVRKGIQQKYEKEMLELRDKKIGSMNLSANFGTQLTREEKLQVLHLQQLHNRRSSLMSLASKRSQGRLSSQPEFLNAPPPTLRATSLAGIDHGKAKSQIIMSALAAGQKTRSFKGRISGVFGSAKSKLSQVEMQSSELQRPSTSMDMGDLTTQRFSHSGVIIEEAVTIQEPTNAAVTMGSTNLVSSQTSTSIGKAEVKVTFLERVLLLYQKLFKFDFDEIMEAELMDTPTIQVGSLANAMKQHMSFSRPSSVTIPGSPSIAMPSQLLFPDSPLGLAAMAPSRVLTASAHSSLGTLPSQDRSVTSIATGEISRPPSNLSHGSKLSLSPPPSPPVTSKKPAPQPPQPLQPKLFLGKVNMEALCVFLVVLSLFHFLMLVCVQNVTRIPWSLSGIEACEPKCYVALYIYTVAFAMCTPYLIYFIHKVSESHFLRSELICGMLMMYPVCLAAPFLSFTPEHHSSIQILVHVTVMVEFTITTVFPACLLLREGCLKRIKHPSPLPKKRNQSMDNAPTTLDITNIELRRSTTSFDSARKRDTLLIESLQDLNLDQLRLNYDLNDFERVLHHPTLFKMLKDVLISQMNVESALFYEDYLKLLSLQQKATQGYITMDYWQCFLKEKLLTIAHMYIEEDGDMSLNLLQPTRHTFLAGLTDQQFELDLLEPIKNEVVKIMFDNAFPIMLRDYRSDLMKRKTATRLPSSVSGSFSG
jgi:hypothetical protein